MKCEWCGSDFVENSRMMALIVSATSAWVCYECALALVEREPMGVIDLVSIEIIEEEMKGNWPRYYSQ